MPPPRISKSKRFGCGLPKQGRTKANKALRCRGKSTVRRTSLRVMRILLLFPALWITSCAPPPADPPGVIRLRCSVFGAKEEADLANAFVRAFEAKHPHIRVQVEPVPQSGYDMRLTMQSAAGTLPDVVFLTDSQIGRAHV